MSSGTEPGAGADPRGVTVAIVGAGNYGSTLAHLVCLGDYAGRVVMTDVVEGRPQGLALDLMHARPLSGWRGEVVGTNGYEELAGADVCVITAGSARRPGMSRMDLLETNAAIVGQVTAEVARVAPGAVIVVVTNPLDEMTALAAEVSGFERHRVMGQAGMLDTARFRHLLAVAAGVDPGEVQAMTLGSHGDTMVPVPSLATVAGRPVTDVLSTEAIAEAAQRTREAGAEVVALLKTGSAYFAPAAAAEKMVRAIATDSGEVMPVSTWLDGQYGLDGVYLGVPARLGRRGVVEVLEVDLDRSEATALAEAADAVRARQATVSSMLG